MSSSVDQPSSSFRPRQASYLRISPRQVLQLVMYLEPAHVDWMTDERLDRVLYALKERIPTKLRKEEHNLRRKSAVAKEKTQVDVYRGSDYQMAYFFRRAGQKHVVMLKDKRLLYPDKKGMQADVQNIAGNVPNLAGLQADEDLVIKAESEDEQIPDIDKENGSSAQADMNSLDAETKPELQTKATQSSIAALLSSWSLTRRYLRYNRPTNERSQMKKSGN
ncbi:hypothetical protein OIV83_006094 [Microbotryomycetes sp. JL201]|nr:hypothetical protein OIV83_006094 [Microbotryomycetes sp. JL201]